MDFNGIVYKTLPKILKEFEYEKCLKNEFENYESQLLKYPLGVRNLLFLTIL